MDYYFAPMEGVTTYIFRREHARLFPGCRKYYAPFITACQPGGLKASQLRDVLPENNEGAALVPQLLSNDAPSFLRALSQLRELGWGEVNLNLGCPSGTVASKKRGSGFLSVPDELDAFLGEVFSGAENVSVKTRAGFADAGEFWRLLDIFGKYPISELIVHPRVRTDFYNNAPDMTAFAAAYGHGAGRLCYNGDLFRAEDCASLSRKFPALPAAMLGRGAVANPALLRQAGGGAPLSAAELREFHGALLESYLEVYSGGGNVLQRMKELWYYWACMFPGGEREVRRIYKTRLLCDYVSAAEALFRDVPMDPAAGFGGQKNSPAF